MNKRILLTGASSGIGRECALLFAEEKWELVLVARREDRLAQVAEDCRREHAVVRTIASNLSDRSDMSGIIGIARDGGAAEPVLVNCAGQAQFSPIIAQTAERIHEQIQVGLVAPILLTRAILPWMIEHGSGHVVNVLSIVADRVLPGAPAYSAVKAGLRMFGRAIAEEHRRQGIRVTNIIPGATDTELWNALEGGPNREDMLPARAVAEAIRDVIKAPRDRSIDELVIMPPKGVL